MIDFDMLDADIEFQTDPVETRKQLIAEINSQNELDTHLEEIISKCTEARSDLTTSIAAGAAMLDIIDKSP